MDCPNCKLSNPPGAIRCDCGYDFATGQMKEPGAVLARLGFAIKRWRAGRGSLLPVRGQGELVVRDGSLSAVLTYDPPGSGWISLGLAVLTYIVVAAVAQVVGVAAGPGWLIWYFIVRAIRKRPTSLVLNPEVVEDAAVDVTRRRLAVKTGIHNRIGWIGFSLKSSPPDLGSLLRQALGDKLREARVSSADTTALVVLLVLVALLVLMIIVGVATAP